MPRRDDRTLELFEIPAPPAPGGGSLNFDAQVCAALSDTLKNCPHDRYRVAADMSRLLAREVSKNMLDAYTAESRDAYNFPLNYVAAFEVATESFALTQLLAKLRGCRVLVGEDALLAELGRVKKAQEELAVRERALKERMRGKR
jgi:hypothetical protein